MANVKSTREKYDFDDLQLFYIAWFWLFSLLLMVSLFSCTMLLCGMCFFLIKSQLIIIYYIYFFRSLSSNLSRSFTLYFACVSDRNMIWKTGTDTRDIYRVSRSRCIKMLLSLKLFPMKNSITQLEQQLFSCVYANKLTHTISMADDCVCVCMHLVRFVWLHLFCAL